MSILEITNISKHFGGLIALDKVSFHLDEKELLGIIGPNGAGKTTLFNIISGAFKPSGGSIFFQGENITALPMHRIAERNLMRTFQESSVWKEETVIDNMLMASYLRRKAGLFGWFLNTSKKEELDIKIEAEAILEYMGLSDFKEELAENLPHGKVRALGICIALISNPKILLLDEPLTGMNPVEKMEMVDIIKGMQERGLTIIIIEHDMSSVMNLVGRIVVLDHGLKIAEGPPSEIKSNKIVIEAYLGTEEE